MQQSPLQFVLDHNFPYQVVHGLTAAISSSSRPQGMAPDLVDEPDDWRIVLRLAARGDIDGYITNDAAMLELPKEMVALTRTRLTLVVTTGAGHNPGSEQAGLLITYLPEVARRTRNQSPRRPTIYRLSAAQLGQFQVSPSQRLDKLAERQNVQPQRLISDTRRKLDLE